MEKPFVFISYSSKDSTIAHQLCKFIEENGIRCWIASRDVQAGENFAEQIVTAINDCSVFLIVASPNSNSSAHVGNEISIAFSGGKKIIPFRTQEYEPTGSSQYYFQHIQWLNAYIDMDDALDRLIKIIGTVIPNAAKSTATPNIELTQSTNPNSDLCKMLEKIDACTNEFKSTPTVTVYEKLSQAIDEFDLSFTKIPLSKRGAITQDWSFLKIQRANIKLCMNNSAFVIMLADQILSYVAKIYSVLSN